MAEERTVRVFLSADRGRGIVEFSRLATMGGREILPIGVLGYVCDVPASLVEMWEHAERIWTGAQDQMSELIDEQRSRYTGAGAEEPSAGQ